MSTSRSAKCLACPPNAVRVWCGYRKGATSRGDFVRKLKTFFIPETVSCMAPFGMTAYLPVILPEHPEWFVPDEIALVFYSSQDAYRTAMKEPEGRDYGTSHWRVFDKGDDGCKCRKSFSKFPVRYSGRLMSRTPYHLFRERTDWQQGETDLTVLLLPKADCRPAAPCSSSAELEALCGALTELQKKPPTGLDGVIAVQIERCVMLWTHCDKSVDTRMKGRYALGGDTADIILKKRLRSMKPGQVKKSRTSSGSLALNMQFARPVGGKGIG